MMPTSFFPTLTCLQEDRTMYQALECCAEDAIGPGGSWAAVLDSGLVNNLGAPCACLPACRLFKPC